MKQMMASLRAAFSSWKELLWVPMGGCHSWTRSSWLMTTKLALPSPIPSQTEPSVKIWKSSGRMEARVSSEWSPYWDGDIILSTSVMTVGIGVGLSHGGMESWSQERGVEDKTWVFRQRNRVLRQSLLFRRCLRGCKDATMISLLRALRAINRSSA